MNARTGGTTRSSTCCTPAAVQVRRNAHDPVTLASAPALVGPPAVPDRVCESCFGPRPAYLYSPSTKLFVPFPLPTYVLASHLRSILDSHPMPIRGAHPWIPCAGHPQRREPRLEPPGMPGEPGWLPIRASGNRIPQLMQMPCACVCVGQAIHQRASWLPSPGAGDTYETPFPWSRNELDAVDTSIQVQGWVRYL